MVVLEMLSTTCGTCLMYTSGTENSYQVYGPNGLDVAEFIGLEVNTSTTDNDISNFISNYNVSFPVCNDISPVAINYQLYYTPSYYVIYPDSSYTTICPMYCNDNRLLHYNRRFIEFKNYKLVYLQYMVVRILMLKIMIVTLRLMMEAVIILLTILRL